NRRRQAAGRREPSGRATLLHAQFRHEPGSPRAHRISAGGQSARAQVLGQALHSQLSLGCSTPQSSAPSCWCSMRRRSRRRRAPRRPTSSPSTSTATTSQVQPRLDLGACLADIPAEFKGSSNHEPPPCTSLVRYRALRHLSALAGIEREAGGSTPNSAMRPRVRFWFALPASGLLERDGIWRQTNPMFETLSERLGAILDKLTRKGALTEADVNQPIPEV